MFIYLMSVTLLSFRFWFLIHLFNIYRDRQAHLGSVARTQMSPPPSGENPSLPPRPSPADSVPCGQILREAQRRMGSEPGSAAESAGSDALTQVFCLGPAWPSMAMTPGDEEETVRALVQYLQRRVQLRATLLAQLQQQRKWRPVPTRRAGSPHVFSD